MNNTISFMSANFVARELGYRMTKGWVEGETATQEWFRPEATFPGRFAEMLDEICELGFSAIDLWQGHLHPAWASDKQISRAADLLKERRLTVSSLAFYLAGDSAELERTGEIANALGVPVIGGGCRAEWLGEKRDEFVDFLERRNLLFGFENHPEKSAAEVLAKIGEAEGGRIGVAIDTGWFGSQSYTAAQAIRELGPRLVHVHLKDIFPPAHPGDDRDIREGAPVTLKDIGHETCAFGEGCVGIEECVSALRDVNYQVGISIEHEPEDHNPMEDIARSLDRLKGWMAQGEVRP